jgi:Trypsin-like peptidase domain
VIDRRSFLLAAAGSLAVSTNTQGAEPSTEPTAIPDSPSAPPAQGLVPTELLMHATVRLECIGAPMNPSLPTPTSIGTGFFFDLFQKDNHAVAVIVTNKHVIKGMVSGSVELTTKKPDGTPDLANHFRTELPNFRTRWIDHPDSSVDVTILPCVSMLENLAKDGYNVYWVGLDPNLIPTDKEFEDLTPVEEVLVVGYPIGRWDPKNNSPIFRKGITATAPYLDFSGKQEFLIDAAIFPGSSGSPVLLFNQGTWAGRGGGPSIGTRIRLLGVNYAVLTYKSTGEIVVEQTPTEMRAVPVLPIPGNLGVCIKASKILDFEPLLVEMGFKPPEGYVMRVPKLPR